MYEQYITQPSYSKDSWLDQAKRSSRCGSAAPKSVLGFVGAGGLGFVIQIYLQSLDYQRLATILLLVLVIVLVMDGISAWLRHHFLLSAQAS